MIPEATLADTQQNVMPGLTHHTEYLVTQGVLF